MFHHFALRTLCALLLIPIASSGCTGQDRANQDPVNQNAVKQGPSDPNRADDFYRRGVMAYEGLNSIPDRKSRL